MPKKVKHIGKGDIIFRDKLEVSVESEKDALEIAVTKSFEGAGEFLKTVCLPAFNQVGYLLKDKIQYWRLNNILKMLEKAKGKLEFEDGELKIKSHPRVALEIIEKSSLVDDNDLQDMWAGLFASSCSSEGNENDENLIFVNLLKLITSTQAKILKYACEKSKKIVYDNGLIFGVEFQISSVKLINIAETSDIQRLDRELDYLRSIYLLRDEAGFRSSKTELIADITPTTLGLHLYSRCNGYNKSPVEYYQTSKISKDNLVSKNNSKNDYSLIGK